MVKVVSLNTPSFAQMAPFSIRITSFVIGGSTLTVPKLKTSTAATKRLQLNARPLAEEKFP